MLGPGSLVTGCNVDPGCENKEQRQGPRAMSGRTADGKTEQGLEGAVKGVAGVRVSILRRERRKVAAQLSSLSSTLQWTLPRFPTQILQRASALLRPVFSGLRSPPLPCPILSLLRAPSLSSNTMPSTIGSTLNPESRALASR